MPNGVYLAMQEEFYRQEYPDQKQRREALKQMFSFVTEIDEEEDVIYADCKVKFWGTKDKRVIPMPFMTESHLRNAFRYTYRNLETIKAEWKSEEKVLNLWNNQLGCLQLIRNELLRRKLVVPSIAKWIDQWDNEVNHDFDDWDYWYEGPWYTGWWYELD